MKPSVTKPIEFAWARMVKILFQPFGIGRWFIIGFTAFLAVAGAQSCSCNFPTNFGSPPRQPQTFPQPPHTPSHPGQPVGQPSSHSAPFPSQATVTHQHASSSAHGPTWSQHHGSHTVHTTPTHTNPFDHVRDFIKANPVLVVTLVVIAVVILIGLWLLFVWISSRAQFMFIDNLATNRAQVVAPWHEFRPQGNSLFGFQLVILLAWIAIFAAVGGLIVFILWDVIQRGSPASRDTAAIVTAVNVGMLAYIVFFVGSLLYVFMLNNVVIPVMYARRCGVVEGFRYGWRQVVRPNLGLCFLFALMSLVLNIAAAIAATMLTCMTCCIAVIPYLGSVLLLPISVFLRCYSLYFVEQFSEELRIFVNDPEGPRCRVCGYSLLGLPPTTLACPECGTAFDRAMLPPPIVLP